MNRRHALQLVNREREKRGRDRDRSDQKLDHDQNETGDQLRQRRRRGEARPPDRDRECEHGADAERNREKRAGRVDGQRRPKFQNQRDDDQKGEARHQRRCAVDDRHQQRFPRAERVIAKQHDGDQRQHRERADQNRGLGRHDRQLDPERARAPRIEREPPLDSVQQVAAVAQLRAQIFDRHAAHPNGISIA